jgi:hypothetical protein
MIFTASFPHKTASMFAYRLLAALADKMGLAFYTNSGPQPGFASFVPWAERTALFGPIRNYIFSSLRQVADPTTITHVYDVAQLRDPLDVIVAQFFSHGWLHTTRNFDAYALEVRQKMQRGIIDIFTYAQMELEGRSGFGGGSIARKFDGLAQATPFSRERLIVRYEDFISDYPAWAESVTAFLSRTIEIGDVVHSINPNIAPVQTGRKQQYANALDYVSAIGLDRKKGKHIRNATPGDHLRFFDADQIRTLRRPARGSTSSLGSSRSG